MGYENLPTVRDCQHGAVITLALGVAVFAAAWHFFGASAGVLWFIALVTVAEYRYHNGRAYMREQSDEQVQELDQREAELDEREAEKRIGAALTLARLEGWADDDTRTNDEDDESVRKNLSFRLGKTMARLLHHRR